MPKFCESLCQVLQESSFMSGEVGPVAVQGVSSAKLSACYIQPNKYLHEHIHKLFPLSLIPG